MGSVVVVVVVVVVVAGGRIFTLKWGFATFYIQIFKYLLPLTPKP